jgi:2-polyprenyl-3-methyl-5-hydroxy-6-metoxy-1,4-benzoquinol methylase
MNYKDKSTAYFSNIRHDLIALIDKNEKGLRVLEIGAAYGETLFYLKNLGVASEAIGIDIFEDTANKANYKPIDRFIFENIETADFPEYYGSFDLILLPDVLEHLIDPKKVLHKVYKYLKDDGTIIVSMPNIRHYSALKKIFFNGDFSYEESGIFDSTHMRFYCRKNIKQLLENSGFKTLIEEGSIKKYKGKSIAKIINKITFGVFEEFFSYQYFFKSKKV